MKNLKYLIAYTGPLCAFLGLYYGGIWSPGMFYLAFGIIPLLEPVLPVRTSNHDDEKESSRSSMLFFDILLYLHVPLLFGLTGFYFYKMAHGAPTPFEQIAMTLNMGTLIGAFGINVAHELGHRERPFERVLAKMLLLPALYMHFIIEHNYGHHRNVGTPKDPATSRRGELVFAFWIRSALFGYLNAWAIEKKRLNAAGKVTWGLQNEMVRFTIIQSLYLVIVGAVFGPGVVVFAVSAAVTGFLLLETVNYIEHYGLMRQKLPSGRYEPVALRHSWNSNHELGRIFLYELTRHADHHFRATRKYQILRHHDTSPQLPMGYPLAMLLSLIPPLWFRTIHPLLDRINSNAPAETPKGTMV
jgi:alkane 1-monooxygenase